MSKAPAKDIKRRSLSDFHHFHEPVIERKRKHLNVSDIVTLMIEMHNVPVKLAVQIGELLKDAPNLSAG